jgi:hypothetical protein
MIRRRPRSSALVQVAEDLAELLVDLSKAIVDPTLEVRNSSIDLHEAPVDQGVCVFNPTGACSSR